MIDMMNHYVDLVMELGHMCNLASEHTKCPAALRSAPERTVSDERFVELADEAYNELGFVGHISFHHHNEPMLYWKRMLDLMDKIRIRVPQSKFLLWTNGTIANTDPRFENFDRVVVTRYPKHENLIVHKSTLVVQETWDERLIDRVDRTTTPCFRPLLEFTIVAGGDVVICCQDWKNEIKLGNVLDDKLSDIVARKAKLLESIVRPMTDETPERCRSCNGKLGIPAHMEIAERPLKFLKDRDIKTRLTGNFYLPDL
jgi:radical SAM protein with 4Fe4S-binding SPASM domain